MRAEAAEPPGRGAGAALLSGSPVRADRPAGHAARGSA